MAASSETDGDEVRDTVVLGVVVGGRECVVVGISAMVGVTASVSVGFRVAVADFSWVLVVWREAGWVNVGLVADFVVVDVGAMDWVLDKCLVLDTVAAVADVVGLVVVDAVSLNVGDGDAVSV